MQEGEADATPTLREKQTESVSGVEEDQTTPRLSPPPLPPATTVSATSENVEQAVENAINAAGPAGTETPANLTPVTASVAANACVVVVDGGVILDDSGCDKDIDSDEDNDDETRENYEGYNGTGRTVTLQMLMSANVLQPGKSLMTIEYLGQKFVGDLLADGKIKSHETETIFLTPSAWAMHCKRIINPEKKSGCGWASVKYKGKKLDVYKNSWVRRCALQKDYIADDDCDADPDKKVDSPLPVVKRTVYQHNTISNRSIMHDANMLIEAVPFSAVGKLQPFLLTLSSSAMLLADFHCHLTVREVCGYFGGTWDVNTHTLAITKAYPCRNTRYDRQRAADVEREIQKQMIKDQLVLVGWYHSHPKFQAEPTLRDCDSQLDYQIRMRGQTEMSYTPCVALIVSPYYDENPTLESVVKAIFIVPPNENKQTVEYGRPMLMQYSVLPDKETPEAVRAEIQNCVDYYAQYRNEVVRFRHTFSDDITYIEKLKNTLYPKFPVKQSDKALWNWICAVLDCEQEDDFIPPQTIKIIDRQDDDNMPKASVPEAAQMPPPVAAAVTVADMKLETEEVEVVAAGKDRGLHSVAEAAAQVQADQQKANELKVLSLQEQLCLPSGLNMNPVRMLSPLATPNLPAASMLPTTPPILAAAPATTPSSSVNLLPPLPPNMPPVAAAATIAATSIASLLPGASPRDSPTTITIPSSSASPAKFEVPVRASPSPAKSDASSHTSHTSRPRNSPAPSPGKLLYGIGGELAPVRNSPSVTPNKQYEQLSGGPAALVPPASAATLSLSSANDLMAASLAQLAGQLPPNFLQTDLAALFQQQHQPQQQQHQQQQRKDYGSSSLNQLAAAAAKVGGGGSGGALKHSHGADLSSDASVAAAVAAYSHSFHHALPRVQETLVQPCGGGGKTKSERSSKSSASSSSSSSSTANSYKTKLMKELDDLKNDPLKMSELMRSPEYAALLLQQAEALGATTLGTLGFGADFSYLTGAGLGLPNNVGSSSNNNNSSSSNNNNNSSSSNNSAVPTASSNSKSKAAAAAALTADYNNLIQASKLLGYDSYMQQAKSNDFNAFLQQQMGAAAAAAAVVAATPPPSASGSSKKQQQQQQQQHHHHHHQHQQQQQQQHQQQQQQLSAQAHHPDYTTLLQTYSKLFDPGNQFGAAMVGATGSSKGAGAAGGSSSSNAHHELSALLAAGVGGMGGMLTAAGMQSSSASTSAKQQRQKDMHAQLQQQQQQQQQQTDMLNQLLQSEKQQSELNALLYHHHHHHSKAADLNALFAAPSTSVGGGVSSSGTPTSSKSGGGGGGGGSGSNSTGAPSPLTDPAAYYNALAAEKMQDYAALFQQQQHGGGGGGAGKYSIPDPLSKSTLAANNMFMSPSALLKIQQDSLSAMMMKPPKSTSSSAAVAAATAGGSNLGRTRESSASPALERLTPTKSAIGSGTSMVAATGNANSSSASTKYNFSAVDLAISSVPSNTPSPAPSDGSNSSSTHRRPSNTPPVDLSRLYGELAPSPLGGGGSILSGATKKRMEFSSIADLAAPPPAKMAKPNDDILNLSHD